MSSEFEDVVRWHKAVDHPVEPKPVPPVFTITDSHALGMKLVREEFLELVDAWEQHDLESLADAMADLKWVINGLAARLGVDLDSVWSAVRKANFGKLGGPRREDGKLLKPEGWKPPDILEALKRGRDLTEI